MIPEGYLPEKKQTQPTSLEQVILYFHCTSCTHRRVHPNKYYLQRAYVLRAILFRQKYRISKEIPPPAVFLFIKGLKSAFQIRRLRESREMLSNNISELTNPHNTGPIFIFEWESFSLFQTLTLPSIR